MTIITASIIGITANNIYQVPWHQAKNCINISTLQCQNNPMRLIPLPFQFTVEKPEAQ